MGKNPVPRCVPSTDKSTTCGYSNTRKVKCPRVIVDPLGSKLRQELIFRTPSALLSACFLRQSLMKMFQKLTASRVLGRMAVSYSQQESHAQPMISTDSPRDHYRSGSGYPVLRALVSCLIRVQSPQSTWPCPGTERRRHRGAHIYVLSLRQTAIPCQ